MSNVLQITFMWIKRNQNKQIQVTDGEICGPVGFSRWLAGLSTDSLNWSECEWSGLLTQVEMWLKHTRDRSKNTLISDVKINTHSLNSGIMKDTTKNQLTCIFNELFWQAMHCSKWIPKLFVQTIGSSNVSKTCRTLNLAPFVFSFRCNSRFSLNQSAFCNEV